MTDYATMQTRIADELNRTGMTTQIQRAILSALDFYQRNRFRFNIGRATTTLSEDVEYYGLPTDFIDLDTAVLTLDTQIDPLEQQSHYWIDQRKRWSNYSGRPYVIAVQADQFRVYPMPDKDDYGVLITYLRKLDVPTSGTSTSAWFTDGEELIRLHAKVDLLQNVIRGPESLQESQVLQQREAVVMSQLRTEYKRTVASGTIMAW